MPVTHVNRLVLGRQIVVATTVDAHKPPQPRIMPWGPPRSGAPEACMAKAIRGSARTMGNHVWKPHVIEFLAIGTAVLDQEIGPERIADPVLVSSVDD